VPRSQIRDAGKALAAAQAVELAKRLVAGRGRI
jgi:hypothetical protein